MCCLASVLVLLGPRAMAVFWWLVDPLRWEVAFGGAIVPILGIVFMPWTTLAFVFGAPGGFDNIELVFIALGFVADLASYGGGYWGNRDQLSGYYRSST